LVTRAPTLAPRILSEQNVELRPRGVGIGVEVH
ncbi:MAG: hypothetical protein ACI9TP_002507, partial [Candidatus Azotimanducaceae bacterium]